MTKPTTDGVVVERIYSDLEVVSLRHMNYLKGMLKQLREGGEATRASFDSTLELYEAEVERLQIMRMLIDKRFSDAEMAAMRLAAVDKRQAQP